MTTPKGSRLRGRSLNAPIAVYLRQGEEPSRQWVSTLGRASLFRSIEDAVAAVAMVGSDGDDGETDILYHMPGGRLHRIDGEGRKVGESWQG